MSLRDRVRSALPDPDKTHLISASYRLETLVLTVDSAAWANRLRYEEAALRDALVTKGEKPFTKLKVRVRQPGSGEA